jgi:signal transduction histidine kinase
MSEAAIQPVEMKRLQGCIDDLMCVQAMPAIWGGLDARRIVDTLLDVLLRVLHLSFACARVQDPDGGPPIAVVRLPREVSARARLRRTRVLEEWWGGYSPTGSVEVANPICTGDVSVAPFRLGLRDEIGSFVAASARPGFPSELETIVLKAAANQVVIGLQEARRLRRAEEQLRLGEALLVEGQKLTHTGNWGWNTHSGELILSREAYRILGLDPVRPAPTFDKAIELLHPEDRPFVQGILASATREAKAYEFEARLAFPDRSVRHVRCVGRPFRSPSGQLEFVGTLIDETDRKRTEEFLHAAQAQLAHVARVITMEKLAASVAHELNQPLAAVMTDAQAGLRWLGTGEPNLGEARSALARIVKQADRASQVLTRIRAFVKKGQAAISAVDVSRMIDEVLSLTRRQIHRARICLRTDLAPDLRITRGDRIQLQQVLVNLVVNAIEAIQARKDGPRELLISARNQDDEYILVAVRDSGIGIDPRAADQLFHPFFTTKAEGTGMGLSISRSIVEAHGGKLWGMSNAGPGATFLFSLPAGRADA